jgi:nickel-dependent lactate racemase
MKNVEFKIGSLDINLRVPESSEVFAMPDPKPLADPAAVIDEALAHSIESPSLDDVIKAKLNQKSDCRAVIVISDNTRPVPYKGAAGILWPIVRKLFDNHFTRERILILVANGTHRPLTETELRSMLDPRIFDAGIPIINHNCRDRSNLVNLGTTSRGSKVLINKNYMAADLKILTGLVESHFMAGVSGGRKSVCPGLIGEESTYIFHGAKMLASPLASDLNLEGNPCHDEALEVALKAGVDYIVNVTLDNRFRPTGVFAGGLREAHQEAVSRIKEYTSIPIEHEYDIVLTHAGFVGINHYQAAKVGVVSIPALKAGGTLIVGANTTDSAPVGSPNYRTMIHLLKLFGPEKFNRLLHSPDWPFVPDQWQVQMWARLFMKIPMENFIYYSPQLTASDYQILPGQDGNLFLAKKERYRAELKSISKALEAALLMRIGLLKEQGISEPEIAVFTDGPYGVPVKS